tara:strand:- start:54 stop:494 length:441 start_codon:yes stop_codon:yes gene_type:complete
MAIPASGAISMSMVAAEFDSEVGANFSLSASAANLSTPIASNIFLAASFYGQSFGVAVTAWTFRSDSGGTWEDADSACEAMNEETTTSTTLYHNGSSALPVDTDVIYTNNPGTTTAAAGVYAYIDGRTKKTFSVNSSGVVSDLANC